MLLSHPSRWRTAWGGAVIHAECAGHERSGRIPELETELAIHRTASTTTVPKNADGRTESHPAFWRSRGRIVG
jgi:hypothetical protein